jgi:WD40 repeat protein
MKGIYVWEAKTGKRQHVFDVVTECIAVSPRGTILAASLRKGKKENGVVALWDWQAGKEISRVQVCGLNWCNPAYSDGKLFARDGIKTTGELLCVDLLAK